MEEEKQIQDIFKRYINGLYTRTDVKALCHTLRSEEGYQKIEKEMDEVWKETELPVDLPDNNELYKKEAQALLTHINKKKKNFSLSPLLKYAAIIALMITIGLGIYSVRSYRADKVILAYTEVIVKNGKQEQVTLPDGTIVTLNAGTTLRYPKDFTANTRLVEMDGEAFFNVKRDENKPFIVRTHDADIKVLGTSFNVKAYQEDEQLAVSVKTGKVQVDMPETQMRLLPNEQITVNKVSGEIVKKSEDAAKVTAWIKGGLYFNRTPIHSVVRDLERMYNTTIELDPQTTFDDYMYGEHDNSSLDAVLNAIQYATGIQHKRVDDRIVLYKTSH